MQTIFRTKQTTHYTTFPNAMLKDRSISFRARGILAMVLSNESDWVVYPGWVADQGTEGIDAVRTAMQELKDAGYAVYTKDRDDKGRITAHVWTFHDKPQPKPAENPSNQPESGFPDMDNAISGKSAPKKEYKEQKDQGAKGTTESGAQRKPRQYPQFHPPTLDEIAVYGAAVGMDHAMAEEFEDHFKTTGWAISSGGKMRDWQAAVRNWVRREAKFKAERDRRGGGRNRNGHQKVHWDEINFKKHEEEERRREEVGLQ